MSEISASLVMELRKETNAGMMECKKALIECTGDKEEAKEWLKKKGILKASEKFSSRSANQGLIMAKKSADGKTAVAVELNSETDFVARNASFQELLAYLTEFAINSKGDIAQFKESKDAATGVTITDKVAQSIAVIGENIVINRVGRLSVDNGVIASYVHGAVGNDMGKIVVLVAIESDGDKEKLLDLGNNIGMHIAAMAPAALSIEQLDKAMVAKHREISQEQAKQSGKPDNVIEKMLEGQMRKLYEEIVLLEQAYVIDNKLKISEVIQQAEKELGTTIKIKDYLRFEIGKN